MQQEEAAAELAKEREKIEKNARKELKAAEKRNMLQAEELSAREDKLRKEEAEAEDRATAEAFAHQEADEEAAAAKKAADEATAAKKSRP